MNIEVFGQYKQLEEVDLERLIEERFQQQEGNTDFEDFYETLLNLYLNPLDLNKVSAGDLDFLYALSPSQITGFLNYKEQHGPIISLYELQAIEEFDEKAISDILPFVTLGNAGGQFKSRPFLKRLLEEQNNNFTLRYRTTLEESIDASRHIGRQDRILGKFRVSHPGDFSFGFLFEKDPGEKFRFSESERTYGFDFYSYHLSLENRGDFEKIVIGDYQMQFGQGLISGAGFAVGKGASTISTIKRNNTGIVPYTSTIENNYYKGMAGTYRLTSNVSLTGFVSSVGEDVGTALDTLASEGLLFATSGIRTSGFHRTSGEIENKDVIRNNTFGGNILFKNPSGAFYAGLTGLYNRFSLNIIPGDQVYQRFNFSGKDNLNLGGYFNYLYDNINFFGEYARSSSGGDAVYTGVIMSLAKELDFSFSYRNYARDFHAINGVGRAFGETRQNFNESGVYWGIQYKPLSKLYFSAYYDRFFFPWLRFRVNAPSDGHEYLMRLTYKPVKKVEMYCQYRQQRKELSTTPEGENLSVLEDELIEQFNLNINYALTTHLKLKTIFLVGWRNFNRDRSIGSMVAQDLSFDLGKFSLNSRFALIDAEEIGVYAYERDVQYGFVRGQFFNGVRNYLILRYKASRNLDLRVKYSRNKTPEDLILRSASVDGVGSTFNGNTITELRFLMRYSL